MKLFQGWVNYLIYSKSARTIVVLQSTAAKLISENQYEKSKIIQLLNDLQEIHGYLPKEELESISDIMQLSMTKIWGIITFYSHYKLQEPAKYTIRICSGTACHVKNSGMLKENFHDHMESVDSKTFTTDSVACLGCCALAPVFEINGEIHGKLNTTKVKTISQKIKSGAEQE